MITVISRGVTSAGDSLNVLAIICIVCACPRQAGDIYMHITYPHASTAFPRLRAASSHKAPAAAAGRPGPWIAAGAGLLCSHSASAYLLLSAALIEA